MCRASRPMQRKDQRGIRPVIESVAIIATHQYICSSRLARDPRTTDLVGLEAWLVVNRHFQCTRALFQSELAESTKIPICVVAVPERQRVNVMMGLVVGVAVVEKAANTTPLRPIPSVDIINRLGVRHTLPPYVSKTSTKPSNFPIV